MYMLKYVCQKHREKLVSRRATRLHVHYPYVWYQFQSILYLQMNKLIPLFF